MRILSENTIAIIIDVQEKLFPHMNDKEKLEKNIITLIKALNILNIPIIITEQYKKGLGDTLPGLQVSFSEYTPFEKMAFSCCDDIEIMEMIRKYNPTNVIISGIEAHVCVMQTAIDLTEMGINAVVVEDCISSRKLNDKNIALQRLSSEGVRITTSESIIFELLRYSGTEKFKGILKLLK